MFIYNNKQKIQCPDNVNALGAFFFFCAITRLLEPEKSESKQNSGSNDIQQPLYFE